MKSHVLIVEDDPLQSEMLAEMLEYKLEFSSIHANNGQEALSHLENNNIRSRIRLIIMDIDMPVLNGMDTLKVIRQKYPLIPVIMLTGKKSVEKAVDCMKLGASDFLNKPYDVTRMVVTIQNAIRLNTLSQEVSRLKNAQQNNTFKFSSLIGYDGGLSSLVKLGQKAAASDIPVLISGETGTGKEVFARAIHGESQRAGKPFVAVNCGAIPSQLIESTLFGHEKGAFTGATEQMKGKFREADGGTIFLDEIGELPLEAQVKLLRVLQQQEVEPVGAAKPVPVNVRILSATNRKLEEDVEQGLFREDLFFRLSVLPLKIIPLRDRKNDIPLLAEHFLKQFAENDPLGVKHLSSKSFDVLLQQDWPGNVRQLENTLHRAVVICDSDMIEPEHFNALAKEKHSDHKLLPVRTDNGILATFTDENGRLKPMDKIEAEVISNALIHTEHNVTQAAKDLGIAKSTFYKKMKLHGLA